MKKELLNKVGYTQQVYNRINKKLKTDYSKQQIENLIQNSISETDEKNIIKIGKNYYLTNPAKNIKITINSTTFRVITVDPLTP